LTGVLGVPHKVARGSSDREDGTGRVNVRVRVASVRAGGGEVISSRDARFSRQEDVIGSDGSGQGGDKTNSGLGLGDGDVHHHIREEISELLDRKLD
tara:strand:+ start:59111 stop:59401 length:291 start_codon:yes stop_codon:yes gene_type:complete